MKMKLFFVGICFMALSIVTTTAMADMISFVSPLNNVDDTTGWSTNDATVELGHSYSLLGGNATVSGYVNDDDANLSHRLTRGLGVYGGELDEIDRTDPQFLAVAAAISSVEHIDIIFAGEGYFVNSIEVRSLFDTDTTGTNEEWAAIAFYNDNEAGYLQTVYLKGSEVVGTDDGDATWTGPAVLVTKLSFYVPTMLELQPIYPDYDFGDFLPRYSEFAVAKLNVSPVPVPGAILLGMLGLGIAGIKLRKFA